MANWEEKIGSFQNPLTRAGENEWPIYAEANKNALGENI